MAALIILPALIAMLMLAEATARNKLSEFNDGMEN